jgi:1-acyl-sn-glycerol-3-phosphate acyltransferase
MSIGAFFSAWQQAVCAVDKHVAAVRSLVTYLVILLYIAVAGPLALVIGAVFRWKRGMYTLGHGGVSLALALAGIRYQVAGREKVPARSVVFCSNHESNIDPPVLFEALHPQLHILYKAELHRFPIMGTVPDVGGFVPIDRGNRDEALASIRRGADSIRAGNSFLIFPEGTRSRTGHLLPFKKGGFIMAIESQAPIVPVAIQGGRDAMHKGSPWVRPVHVTVRIGDPIATEGLTLADRDTLIERVRTAVEQLLREGPVWT